MVYSDHEIGHIVSEHQGIYLDNLDSLESNIQEQEADNLAQNWLVDRSMYGEFVRVNNPKFSAKSIESFAATQNRHAGIILGRLHHDKFVQYQSLRKLLVKVSPFLQDWIDR